MTEDFRKNPPDKIWLQVDEPEISWWWHPVHEREAHIRDGDVEYIRADLVASIDPSPEGRTRYVLTARGHRAVREMRQQ